MVFFDKIKKNDYICIKSVVIRDGSPQTRPLSSAEVKQSNQNKPLNTLENSSAGAKEGKARENM